uniref:Uncharacterized protein n=1 Tax=Bionectria ochroleuca TaxID=29856 RepID=A0A8H7TND8_BIOOC
MVWQVSSIRDIAMDLDNLQDNSNLSVLNPHPSQIPGPNLFHHLVRSPSGSTALEHLENGSRTSYTYGDLHLASDRIAAQITAATSPAAPESSSNSARTSFQFSYTSRPYSMLLCSAPSSRAAHSAP